MLAEILANPAAWPLWGVFLFAATMFPLGFMLPGCVCCGSSACTECGHFVDGYTSGQNEFGRMCCTGTVASSVTLRITNNGSATSSFVERGSGASYQKRTSAFSCSSFAGDYVLPLNRTVFGTTDALCKWILADESVCETQINMQMYPFQVDPNNNVGGTGTLLAFPYYYIGFQDIRRIISGTVRFQTCSGYPGPEICNIGTYYTSSYWLAIPPFNQYPSALLSSQQCAASGITLATDQKFFVSGACDFVFPNAPPPNAADTGCSFTVELV